MTGSCDGIAEIAELTDESVCPTLVRKGLRHGRAGAFAGEPILSQLPAGTLPRSSGPSISARLNVAYLPVREGDFQAEGTVTGFPVSPVLLSRTEALALAGQAGPITLPWCHTKALSR